MYVIETNNCVSPNLCNLVLNGNFEEHSSLNTNSNTFDFIEKACNWSRVNLSGTPKYYNQDSNLFNSDVPCNFAGYETDNISLNKGYVGLGFVKNSINTYLSETIKTKLSSNLLPNSNYQLSFDLSLAESTSISSTKIQAYL